MSSRPKLITALAVMQYLMAALCLAGVIKIILVMHSNILKYGDDGLEETRGLTIGAAWCLVWVILSVVSASALWRMRKWGRWLGLAANGIIVLALIYSNVDDYSNHSLDGEDMATTVFFILVAIPFLLPAVGRALRNNSTVSTDVPQPVTSGQE